MKRRHFCRVLGLGGAVSIAGCLSEQSVQGTDTAETHAEGSRSRTTLDAPDPDAGVAYQPGNDWATYGVDDQHTGVLEGGVGPNTGTVAWKGVGNSSTLNCAPTVADGTVYVGTAADEIHAFDGETGDRQWTYSARDVVETSPAIVDGGVYAADLKGTVYALNADGSERWTHETNNFVPGAAVAVRDGTLFVGTGGAFALTATNESDFSKTGHVLAFDTATGDVLWEFAGAETDYTGPTLGGGRVYVAGADGTVLALDPGNGAERWRAELTGSQQRGAEVRTPLVYVDDTLYAWDLARGAVVALDASDGTTEWTTVLDVPNVDTTVAVDGDHVYVAATRDRMVAGDRGAIYLPRNESTYAEPEYETAGGVYALSTADGSIAWKHESGSHFHSPPAAVGDRLYVLGNGGLQVFDRSDGTPLTTIRLPEAAQSRPTIVNGRAYVGTADGHLYCLGGTKS